MAVMEHAVSINDHTGSGLTPLPIFSHWADVMDSLGGPFRDRRFLPARLQAVYSLVRDYRPEYIIQAGAHGELYAQAASHAAPEAECLLFDAPGPRPKFLLALMPLRTEKIRLAQGDLLRMEFAGQLPPNGRTVLFINEHNAERRPFIEHAIRNIVRHLPEGSLVICDSMWLSGQKLGPENLPGFVNAQVLKNRNDLADFSLEYGPLPQGGSAAGLPGTQALLKFIHQSGLRLEQVPNGHFAYFFTGKSREAAFDPAKFKKDCGEYHFDSTRYYLDGQSPPEGFIERAKKYERDTDWLSYSRDILRLADSGGLSRPGLLIAVCNIKSAQYSIALSTLLAGAPTAKSQELVALARDRARHLAPERRNRAGLTIFALPKGFKDEIAVIQRNAIASWALLPGRPEIILLGDDPGTAEAAREFGAKHVPAVQRNEFGTPLLDSMFSLGQRHSDTDVVAYVNSDIILMDDFARAVELAKKEFDSFLMVGRRMDLDVYEPLDFSNPAWQREVRELMDERGFYYYPEGMDYFAFTPGIWPRVPAFALGRFTWDNWLVYGALVEGCPVIDASAFVNIAHQNHACVRKAGGQSIYDSPEGKRNQSFLLQRQVGNAYATHQLNADGVFEKRDKPALNCYAGFSDQRIAWLKRQILENLKMGRRDLAEAKADDLAMRYSIAVEI